MADPTLDPSRPPPGWLFRPNMDAFVREGMCADTLAEAHEVYAREASPAVLAFAEKVAAWTDSQAMFAEWHEYRGELTREQWYREQIRAAARGERELP